MEKTLKPEMKLLQQGKKLKLYKISGKKGMQLPPHHSTNEVIVIIQSGEAILTIEKNNTVLKDSDSVIIPAGKTHSIFIQSDFEALAIMANEAVIKFEKNIYKRHSL